MSELRELLDLPESVAKSAFVVQLSEGVRHPEAMLHDYAVTPDLVRAFDQGLALTKAALDGHKSVAAYVHGSFGSGKSHFMSVLSLMLSDDPDHQRQVWHDDAFHALRDKHSWLHGKKILRLHLHMQNAPTLEAKVFPEYLARTRELFPDAVLPALFEDDKLFANARELRATLGDEAFFSKLNGGRSADSRWGARAEHSTWSAETFERATSSTSPDERQKLFNALVRTHFTAFAGSTHGYVDLDRGLGELSRHAKRLGFDAVAFFFDEAVLWLANGASDRAWVTREMAKLAKMVEAQDSRRDAPLVSFLARQRDIVELVGDQIAGGELHALREAQRFWEGRFGTITLPDRNLPAIVRKRVVRPKNDAARARLEGAFEDLRRKLGTSAWQTLLGDIGVDEAAFRLVYPFSPALIEVLVAMSATLQRERTALRLLMEILVDHLGDFELGKLVPVGDLFDAIASGEEPMDGARRAQFQAMRQLYQLELLPLLQLQNKTNTAETCQRLRDSHPPQLGCSGCTQSRCRNDNRLVKTLLLAALVPNSPVLKDLTVSRVVALNHGTLRSTIPGNEVTLAAGRLRDLAAQVGKVRVGDQKDPIVFIKVEGVDLKPIIDSARDHDKPGARKVKLRAMLYTAFGHANWEVPEFDAKVDWRGTRREGSVCFGNVREMDESRFRVRAGHDFRIVVDYPFDDPGHTPQEDESRVHELREKLDERTVIWLPDFFSEAVQADLGMLVVLDNILTGDAWRTYLANMRADDQQRALQDLQSLRSQKQNRVLRAIESAYNLTTPGAGQLDATCTVAEHFHVLKPERRIPNLSVTQLSDAVDSLARALLSECFPRHPKFNTNVSKKQLADSLRAFQRLCESEGRRANIDKADRKDAEVCAVLNIVALTEANVVVRDEPFADMERDLRADGVDLSRPVTVEKVRAVLDPRRVQGLTAEVADLLVLAYASWSGRELLRGDRVLDEPTLGALPDEAELALPRLPTAEVWERALHRAGAYLGVARGASALRTKNVRRLADEVEKARLKAVDDGVLKLGSLLDARARLIDRDASRVKTAAEAQRFVQSIEARDPIARIEALAAFESSVTEAALGRCVASARGVAAALADTLLWQNVESFIALDRGDAREVVTRAKHVLNADEQTLPLTKEIATIREEVGRIIADMAPRHVVDVRPPSRSPDPPPKGMVQRSGSATTLSDARAQIEALRAALDAAEQAGATDITLRWTLDAR